MRSVVWNEKSRKLRPEKTDQTDRKEDAAEPDYQEKEKNLNNIKIFKIRCWQTEMKEVI